MHLHRNWFQGKVKTEKKLQELTIQIKILLNHTTTINEFTCGGRGLIASRKNFRTRMYLLKSEDKQFNSVEKALVKK